MTHLAAGVVQESLNLSHTCLYPFAVSQTNQALTNQVYHEGLISIFISKAVILAFSTAGKSGFDSS